MRLITKLHHSYAIPTFEVGVWRAALKRCRNKTTVQRATVRSNKMCLPSNRTRQDRWPSKDPAVFRTEGGTRESKQTLRTCIERSLGSLICSPEKSGHLKWTKRILYNQTTAG